MDTASDSDPIASFVPLIMFAVLFGLSMDYQVFLVGQIEQHRAGAARTTRAIAGWPRRGGQGDHRCGADHDGRVRRLHPGWGPDREAVRGEAVRRRRARGDVGTAARPGDSGARRARSSGAGLGRPLPPPIDIEGAKASSEVRCSQAAIRRPISSPASSWRKCDASRSSRRSRSIAAANRSPPPGGDRVGVGPQEQLRPLVLAQRLEDPLARLGAGISGVVGSISGNARRPAFAFGTGKGAS